MNVQEIYNQAAAAVEALVLDNRPHFNPVRLMVVGCSSSEIAGGVIGHDSTYEYGEAAVYKSQRPARCRIQRNHFHRLPFWVSS